MPSIFVFSLLLPGSQVPPKKIRDLTQKRGREGRQVKRSFYFTLEFLICRDLFSVPVGIKTFP